MGVRLRVAQARVLVAEGDALAAVARVLQATRQAVYRTPKPRSAPQRRPVSDPVDVAIVAVAKDNPTDGYRMVWALTRRKLGRAVGVLARRVERPPAAVPPEGLI